MSNTRIIIEKHLGDLLDFTIGKNIRAITIDKVINILLEIENSLEDVVIDGDDLNKYFNKKIIKPK